MGFVVIFFLYAHTYWCYSSIVRSLTLFNCKSCSYTCTHTLHTFLISVCIFCVRVHFYFLWSTDERAFGVLHRTGMPLILYEFYCYDDFSFQFHCTPLFRRTFNRRHWQFTWKRTIYSKHILCVRCGVVRCVWKCMLFGFARFACYVLCLA